MRDADKNCPTLVIHSFSKFETILLMETPRKKRKAFSVKDTDNFGPMNTLQTRRTRSLKAPPLLSLHKINNQHKNSAECGVSPAGALSQNRAKSAKMYE